MQPSRKRDCGPSEVRPTASMLRRTFPSTWATMKPPIPAAGEIHAPQLWKTAVLQCRALGVGPPPAHTRRRNRYGGWRNSPLRFTRFRTAAEHWNAVEILAAVRFAVEDPRYQWLQAIRAVWAGEFDESNATARYLAFALEPLTSNSG